MELTTLFAVGTFWFWTILILGFFVTLFCIANERGVLAILTMIAVLAILNYAAEVPISSYVIEHPILILFYVLGYFGVGVLWSILKWWLYVSRQREIYEEAKARFLKYKKIDGDVVPDELRGEWRSIVSGEAYQGDYGLPRFEYKPEARKHKSNIIKWMTYWPWSMIWTLISDFIRKIFKKIYHYLQVLYQKISNGVFAGTDTDLGFQKTRNP